MRRRQFLAGAAAGAGGYSVPAPAVAQSTPQINWRLTSAFPKSLDTLYGASEAFSKYIADATDGKFLIQTFAAGEIVGPFQSFDAVRTGTVEVAHGPAYYFVGIDPTFALFADFPFGPNTRQRFAWFYDANGSELLNAFLSKYGVHAILGGATGVQMGGWFRKEIKSAADLQGLKFRIAGLAGQVFAKLGAIPQQIPGGETYAALERGTIDAVEWVGPYDDEKLGFNKVAPFYYYPGFWEGGPVAHFWIAKAKWEELPKNYKAVVEAAAARTSIEMLAKYDARNPAALRRLVANGAQLRPFPQDVMDAALKAAIEVYGEISKLNADFNKVYEALRAYRNEEYLWFQVAEFSYDSFMIRARGRS